MKKVAIVVLNYKTYDETIECLDSLFKVTYPNAEIIVVDNASGNNSLGQIAVVLDAHKKKYSRIDSSNVDEAVKSENSLILFQSPSNRGYSAGNNWGIKIALGRKADFVMLLNNDTIVDPGFLEPLVEFAEADERVAAVGPKIVTALGDVDPCCARGRLSFWGWCNMLTLLKLCFWDMEEINKCRGYYYKGYDYDVPKEVATLSGACMMIRSSAIKKIGLLDESVFLMLEELILTEKIIGAGMYSFIVPSSRIVHKGSGTIGKESSVQMRKINIVSREYYMKEYRHWNWLQRKILLFRPPFLDVILGLMRQIKKLSQGEH